MSETRLKKVSRLFHLEAPIYTQLCHAEDGEPYQVWKVETEGRVYILKEAKEHEAEVYQKLLNVVGIMYNNFRKIKIGKKKDIACKTLAE